MKELIVISGKGGTGKTSLTAAFCHLASKLAHGCVCADCDVDAADLHLILSPEVEQSQTFTSGHEATIRQEDCTACGLCKEYCTFDAIIQEQDGTFRVDPYACEGCKVCVEFCPVQAIDFPSAECGIWNISTTRFGKMVHARLHIGAENSGKLVSLVRQQAREIAAQQGAKLVIVDGPPGIGCPVIASITGADAVLIVTEPSVSGLHDFERVAQLCRHFNIPAYLCINKYDINPAQGDAISTLAEQRNIPTLARINHDHAFTAAQIERKTITEYLRTDAADSATSQVRALWETLSQHLNA
ncbi:MAG: ATP-binding protein [Desulfuromonadaceae bacterium]|nr:ATP-binding protein [Desulfuromonas sp.]MDY0185545.1 ATP-binding protein [Desulfuromonadaceae bacterium]